MLTATNNPQGAEASIAPAPKPVSAPKLSYIEQVKAHITEINANPDSASIETTVQLCELDSPERVAELIAYRDQEKENLLHYLIRHPHAMPHFFKIWQLYLGREAMLQWLSHTSNKDGNPIALHNKLSGARANAAPLTMEIMRTLSMRTAADHLPKLTQQLDPTDILDKFPEAKQDPKLIPVLQDCYSAVNYCRQHIKYSSTHPEIVRHKKSTAKVIREKVNTMRTQSYRGGPSTAISHETANCGEFAELVFDYLGKHHSTHIIKTERVHLLNGDHSFVLVNRTMGDIEKPETWNPETIVVDAWSGKVFFGAQIYTELMDYKHYPISHHDKSDVFNAYFEFNPQYQQIEALATETFDPATGPTDTKNTTANALTVSPKHDAKATLAKQLTDLAEKKHFHSELKMSITSLKKSVRDIDITHDLCSGKLTALPDQKTISASDFSTLYNFLIRKKLSAIDPRLKKTNFGTMAVPELNDTISTLRNLYHYARKNNLHAEAQYLKTSLEAIYIAIFPGNYIGPDSSAYIAIDSLITQLGLNTSPLMRQRMSDAAMVNIDWKKPHCIALVKKLRHYKFDISPHIESFKKYYSIQKIKKLSASELYDYLDIAKELQKDGITSHFISTLKHCKHSLIQHSVQTLLILKTLYADALTTGDVANQQLIKQYVEEIFSSLCTGEVFPYHTASFQQWEETTTGMGLCTSAAAKATMADTFILSIDWNSNTCLSQLEKITKYKLNIENQLFHLFDQHYTLDKIHSLSIDKFQIYIALVNYFSTRAIQKLISVIRTNPEHPEMETPNVFASKLKPIFTNADVPAQEKQKLAEAILIPTLDWNSPMIISHIQNIRDKYNVSENAIINHFVQHHTDERIKRFSTKQLKDYIEQVQLYFPSEKRKELIAHALLINQKWLIDFDKNFLQSITSPELDLCNNPMVRSAIADYFTISRVNLLSDKRLFHYYKLIFEFNQAEQPPLPAHALQCLSLTLLACCALQADKYKESFLPKAIRINSTYQLFCDIALQPQKIMHAKEHIDILFNVALDLKRFELAVELLLNLPSLKVLDELTIERLKKQINPLSQAFRDINDLGNSVASLNKNALHELLEINEDQEAMDAPPKIVRSYSMSIAKMIPPDAKKLTDAESDLTKQPKASCCFSLFACISREPQPEPQALSRPPLIHELTN